ncbi:MAG TPA: DUF1403 family protein, partial [Roseiarcus sp.]
MPAISPPTSHDGRRGELRRRRNCARQERWPRCALLDEDSLAAATPIAGLSERGARRLFGRLAALGAIRELTERATSGSTGSERWREAGRMAANSAANSRTCRPLCA